MAHRPEADRSEADRPARRLGRLLLALGVLAGLPEGFAVAPARASGPGCGGDAFSSAEVVERRRDRPARRGPLTSVPDTLCADLADARPWRIDLQAGPPGIDAAPSAPSAGTGGGGPPVAERAPPARGTGPRDDGRPRDGAGRPPALYRR